MALNNKKFIEKAEKIHNYRYNYFNIKYINSKTKLEIICKLHGSFWQIPTNHLKGKGCSKCKGIKMSIARRMSLETFINNANKVHNNFYDYSLSEYGNNNGKKLKIICKIHGEFLQTPGQHLQGHGCLQCSYQFNNFRKSDWIKRANGRQGTFYIIKCWNDNEEFFKSGITYKTTKKRYYKHHMPYNYKIVKEIKSYDLNYIYDLEKIFMKFNIKNHYSPIIKFGGSMYECFKH